MRLVCGLVVKRLRRQLFSLETRVRFPAGPRMAPSSNRSGSSPFKAKIGVRVSQASPYKTDTAKYNVKHLIVKIWLSTYICLEHTKIAQLTEHRIHTPSGTGLIPVLGTSSVG